MLEAAEYLESRGQGGDKRRKQSFERQLSETGASTDSSDIVSFVPKTVKEGRTRTKSGSTRSSPPVFDDNDFVRAGTREVHNKLEKNRRAHLKECFDFLKRNIPNLEDRRTSNLGILRSSLRYIQNLKRKEREFELEMQKFAHEKIVLQEKIHTLKGELNKMNIHVDLNAISFIPDTDNDSNSTSTATERGTPPPSDHDEQDDDEEEAEDVAMETNSPTPKSPRKRKLSGKKNYTEVYNHSNSTSSAKIMAPIPINGMISRASSSPALSTSTVLPSPKKVIPITLSLSGPVPSPTMSVISAIYPRPPVSEMNISAGKMVEIPAARPPVTQILHRTLQQRQQALLTQKTATQSSTISKVSSAPLTAAQLKSPPLSQPSPAVTVATSQATTQIPLIVKDGITTSSKVLNASVGTTVSKAGTTAAFVPSVNIPYYMASLQKLAHPVLVTSLMTPAVGVQSSAPSTSVAASVSAVLPSASSALNAKPAKQDSLVKFENTNSVQITPTSIRTLNNIPIALVSSVPKSESSTTTSTLASTSIPIRPMFNPSVIQGQLAWPFLTIPRSNIIVTSGSLQTSQVGTSGHVSTVTNQLTSHPLISLAQLNQNTQNIVTPMSVMSPGIQVAPTTLTQAQLTSMFTNPLLKQIPLGIPTSLLQSGQVLGQQVLKPVVVVTVQNVMTQSPATLPSNAVVKNS